MIVFYQHSLYRVPFIIGIKILSDEIQLLSRRLLRTIKRYFLYGKSLLLSILLFIAVLFPIYHIGASRQEYTSICDVLWESKTFILSTFILTYVSIVSTAEYRRHSSLKAQYNQYCEYQYEVSDCIDSLCAIIGITEHRDTFLTDLHSESMISIVKTNILSNTTVSTLTQEQCQFVLLSLENLNAIISSASSFLSASPLVNSCDSSNLSRHFFDLQKLIRQYILINFPRTTFDVANLIIILINTIFPTVAILRRPWRASYDFCRNNRISYYLRHHGKMISGLYDTTLYWIVP